MSRSFLQFPDAAPLFITSIPVQITDLNYGNHLGNDRMLALLHEARVRMLQTHGMSEMEAGGASLIMGESLVIYKGEAFYGDVLDISIWADDISAASFDLLYKVTTVRAGTEVVIAQAKTVMICFDYAARKTRRVTARLLELFGQGG
ncbi:MAG: hypothetical protein BGO09_04845 [Bacteroidetes bacterium 47-18]|nr:MAG: hypothetical protein BGO09_04845 [Bacteroidetes bacterium 47-18]